MAGFELTLTLETAVWVMTLKLTDGPRERACLCFDRSALGGVVLTDIKNRGVTDTFFLVCDGLKGLPDVVGNVWPLTTVQTCIIHLIRNTFKLASKKEWDAVKRVVKPLYTAPTVDAARAALDDLTEIWSARALSRSSAGAIENQTRRFRWLVPVREVTAVFEPVQRCIREQLRGPRRLTRNGDLVLPPPSNDHFALE